MKTCKCFYLSMLILSITGVLSAQEFAITPQYIRAETETLKNDIILSGDEGAMSEIGHLKDSEYFWHNGRPNTYEIDIPYLLIMANRYNSISACLNIYTSTKSLYDNYGLTIDAGAWEFISFYLQKGADLPAANRMDSLCQIFCLDVLYKIYSEGKSGNPDIKKAEEYKKRAESLIDNLGITRKENLLDE